MPPKKSYPRNETIPVSITVLDREALDLEAARRKKSVSTIAYEMMQRGSLQTLVSNLVASRAANLPENTEGNAGS